MLESRLLLLPKKKKKKEEEEREKRVDALELKNLDFV